MYWKLVRKVLKACEIAGKQTGFEPIFLKCLLQPNHQTTIHPTNPTSSLKPPASKCKQIASKYKQIQDASKCEQMLVYLHCFVWVVDWYKNLSNSNFQLWASSLQLPASGFRANFLGFRDQKTIKNNQTKNDCFWLFFDCFWLFLIVFDCFDCFWLFFDCFLSTLIPKK